MTDNDDTSLESICEIADNFEKMMVCGMIGWFVFVISLVLLTWQYIKEWNNLK